MKRTFKKRLAALMLAAAVFAPQSALAVPRLTVHISDGTSTVTDSLDYVSLSDPLLYPVGQIATSHLSEIEEKFSGSNFREIFYKGYAAAQVIKTDKTKWNDFCSEFSTQENSVTGTAKDFLKNPDTLVSQLNENTQYTISYYNDFDQKEYTLTFERSNYRPDDDNPETPTTPTTPPTPDTNPDGSTTTETKPDGSTTVTETKPDGSTTITETKPDGSTTITEANPDGSSTTTESKADGTTTETSTSKPVTDESGNTSQTTTETTTGKDGVTESKTETTIKPDGTGSATTESTTTKLDGTKTESKTETTINQDGTSSSTTESTTTKLDGTKTESKTETTINQDGSTASSTTATTTDKNGTVTESKTETTTSTVTNEDGSTTEIKQESTTSSTGSKSESTTVTTVNKDGSTTATTTASSTDHTGTVTESKTESTTSQDGIITEISTTTETKANGTVTEKTTETTTMQNGSSTATTTATVTKADGTTVESKTESSTSLSTNKDTGAVTETKKETTTSSNGVKSEGTTVTEIQKDGTITSTETVTASDSTGTTASRTTIMDSKGEVSSKAEATVSDEAVAEAAKTGGTVSIPLEVPVFNSDKASSQLSVSVPDTTGPVAVSVSLTDSNPGTVAVLVHEDGTREVIRKSVAGDEGISIPLNGSATVEFVDNSKQFDDVKKTDWHADAVAFASAHEFFSGTSENTFSPDANMTRGMLATVLHSVESNPKSNAEHSFGDIDNNSWYSNGVKWASEKGITSGYDNGNFGPNDDITREQLAVMLWAYAGSPKSTHDVQHFNDYNDISDYSMQAIRWANEHGYLAGSPDGKLFPGAKATRAQVAQVLMAFQKNLY